MPRTTSPGPTSTATTASNQIADSVGRPFASPTSPNAAARTIAPATTTFVADGLRPDGLREDDIRVRAFQIFQARGPSPGAATEDWEQARRELLAERSGKVIRRG